MGRGWEWASKKAWDRASHTITMRLIAKSDCDCGEQCVVTYHSGVLVMSASRSESRFFKHGGNRRTGSSGAEHREQRLRSSMQMEAGQGMGSDEATMIRVTRKTIKMTRKERTRKMKKGVDLCRRWRSVAARACRSDHGRPGANSPIGVLGCSSLYSAIPHQTPLFVSPCKR